MDNSADFAGCATTPASTTSRADPRRKGQRQQARNAIVRERADHEIDATGLICPEPLMVLRNKVRDVSPGEIVYVVTTDPSTVRDFTNYCRFLNHELVAREEDQAAGIYRFLIRKGGA